MSRKTKKEGDENASQKRERERATGNSLIRRSS